MIMGGGEGGQRGMGGVCVGGGCRARLLDRCVSAICTHYQRLYRPCHQPRCNGASSTFHIIIPPRPGSPRRGVWLETQRERWGEIDRMKEGVIEERRWKGALLEIEGGELKRHTAGLRGRGEII